MHRVHKAGLKPSDQDLHSTGGINVSPFCSPHTPRGSLTRNVGKSSDCAFASNSSSSELELALSTTVFSPSSCSDKNGFECLSCPQLQQNLMPSPKVILIWSEPSISHLPGLEPWHAIRMHVLHEPNSSMCTLSGCLPDRHRQACIDHEDCLSVAAGRQHQCNLCDCCRCMSKHCRKGFAHPTHMPCSGGRAHPPHPLSSGWAAADV